MKRSALRNARPLKIPIAWRQAEYAALRANEADTCDDRVSEDIFDIEDERENVAVIVQALSRGAN